MAARIEHLMTLRPARFREEFKTLVYDAIVDGP